MHRLFVIAELRGERIPWEIGEAWARQIVAVVSIVHAKNVVLGLLDLETIFVRADGSIALETPKATSRCVQNYSGQ